MTCIVGLEHEGKVWIGGDSAGVAGHDVTVRSDEKVFRNGEFIMGFTSSFRMGDILRYALDAPEQNSKQSDRGYLCTSFIDAVRKSMSDGGFKTTKDGADVGGVFLLGYRGSLYYVGSDFQIGLAACGYDAVGCGEDYAKGVLFATKKLKPTVRIRMALAAAEQHNGGVRGPFKMVSL